MPRAHNTLDRAQYSANQNVPIPKPHQAYAQNQVS